MPDQPTETDLPINRSMHLIEFRVLPAMPLSVSDLCNPWLFWSELFLAQISTGTMQLRAELNRSHLGRKKAQEAHKEKCSLFRSVKPESSRMKVNDLLRLLCLFAATILINPL